MSLQKAIKQNIETLLAVNNDFRNDVNLALEKLNPLRLAVGEPVYKNEEYKPNHEKDCALYGENQKLVRHIRKKYNLSNMYHHILTFYLEDKKLYDDFEKEISWKHLPFITKDPANPKEKIVALPLTPEFGIKEIQKIWKKIADKRDELYKEIYKTENILKIKEKKNHNRDIEIIKLKKKNLSAIKITKAINNKYPNECIAYQDISKIVSRMKMRAKKIIKDT